MSDIDKFPVGLVIAFVIFYFVVYVLSVVGNCWVMVTCYKTLKRKGSSLMWFVLNLATADLIFTFLTIFNGIGFLYRWVGGEIVCKFHGFLVETCYSVSISTLVVISYERLTAITDPLNARARNFTNRGYRRLLIIWGVCLIGCVPLAILYQMVREENGELVCNNTTWGDVGRQIFYSLHAFFFYIFPLSYMIFSQSKIFLALRSRRTVPSQRDAERSNRRHQKIAKTLFALTVAFAICWSPFMITRTLMYFHIAEPGALWRMSQLLICLNAVLDPIMYGIYGGNLKATLRQKCCFRSPRNRLERSVSLEMSQTAVTCAVQPNAVKKLSCEVEEMNTSWYWICLSGIN